MRAGRAKQAGPVAAGAAGHGRRAAPRLGAASVPPRADRARKSVAGSEAQRSYAFSCSRVQGSCLKRARRGAKCRAALYRKAYLEGCMPMRASL